MYGTYENDKRWRAVRSLADSPDLPAAFVQAGTGTWSVEAGQGGPSRLRVLNWRGQRLITRGHLTPLGHPALPPPYFRGGSVIVAPTRLCGKEN